MIRGRGCHAVRQPCSQYKVLAHDRAQLEAQQDEDEAWRGAPTRPTRWM